MSCAAPLPRQSAVVEAERQWGFSLGDDAMGHQLSAAAPNLSWGGRRNDATLAHCAELEMKMRLASLLMIGVNALIHVYIAWFEIFAWEARGPNVFTSFPPDLFPQTVQMAANQGIYNAFLAAGLIWALCIKDRVWQRNVAVCFLVFVAVAGLFGAITVTPRTLMVQTLPAALALAAVFLSRPKSD